MSCCILCVRVVKHTAGDTRCSKALHPAEKHKVQLRTCFLAARCTGCQTTLHPSLKQSPSLIPHKKLNCLALRYQLPRCSPRGEGLPSAPSKQPNGPASNNQTNSNTKQHNNPTNPTTKPAHPPNQPKHKTNPTKQQTKPTNKPTPNKPTSLPTKRQQHKSKPTHQLKGTPCS